MAGKEKELYVFAHLDDFWAPCGRLKLIENGPEVEASEFAYGIKYLERPNAVEIDPVSLDLSDRAAIRGKTIFPANGLTIFGGIRDAAPDAWGRRVIEAKLKAPANSLPESTYLIHAGSERVGALDIRASLTAAPLQGYHGGHNLQHLMEAADRIEEGLPVPAHLDEIFNDGTALGGARPKASVRDANEVLWLAKFSSKSDQLDIPAIETATLKLAKECGMTVPQVETLSMGDRSLMKIRRFDRYWAKPGTVGIPDDFMTAMPGEDRIEMRLPFISGLTLLGCHEAQSREKAYSDLAQAVRKHCHPSVIRDNNRELYARMIFNILVTNDDDHLRNHGFLWDGRLRGWRLSPLYDVMPRATISTERQLHLGVGQMGRWATLDNALTSHEMFTLSEVDALSIIDKVWRVVRQWKTYFDDFGVPDAQITKVSSAFRHIDDVATATLKKKLLKI